MRWLIFIAYPGLALWRALCRYTLYRFRRRIEAGREVNEAVLKKQLANAAETDIGRRFDFAGILKTANPVEAYRRRVPLNGYAEHADDIERIAAGEKDVLFAGQPLMFVATSGTSNDPKLLPMTREQQLSALHHIALLSPAMRWEAAPELKLSQRSINLMLASNRGNKLSGGMQLGMSSAGGMRKVLKAAPFIWTSPRQVFEMTEHKTALYLHALFGLTDPKAGCIEAVFGTHIVSWASMLMRKREQLIADLAMGRIDPKLNLDPDLRRSLERKLTPDPQRALAVEKAFAAGERGILARLWPQLRVLSTAVSGAFAVSLPQLRWLTGDQVRICGTCFGATESMLGVNLWPSNYERYVLSVGEGYFEFLPLSEVDQPAPLTVDLAQLREGQRYEIVVTNFAGLYRYRLGDVVRVVDTSGSTPVFEFDHRLGDVIDLAGEKTTQRHTREAIRKVAVDLFGSANVINNYTLALDISVVPYRYHVYLELADDSLADRCVDFAERFDQELQNVNLSYRTLARAQRRLDQPAVTVVKHGAFDQLEENHYRRKPGTSRNQVKIPHLLTDTEQISLLDQQALGTDSHRTRH
jgi:hypothetical protein